jgi:hypothetical protein
MSSPLAYIDSFFDEALSEKENVSAALDAFNVKSIFSDMLRDRCSETYQALSPASEASLSTEKLYRYRGLIRDIYDVEFYSAVVNVVDKEGCNRLRFAKYRDSVDDANVSVDFESPNNVTLERYRLSFRIAERFS